MLANTVPAGFFNKHAAMEYVGIKNEVQFSKLIKVGRIVAEPLATIPGTKILRHLFSKQNLDRYLATKGSRKPLSEGNLFKVRLTAAQQVLFAKTFPEITLEKGYHYDPAKSKAYRAKRAAKAKATPAQAQNVRKADPTHGPNAADKARAARK